MKNVFALFVAEVIWSINTLRDARALSNVLVNCSRVSSEGLRDVFCLTVPGISAFAIESGLIVHNTRYLWMSGRERMIPTPVAEKDNYSYDFGDSKPDQKWMQAINLEYPFSRRPER